MVCIRGILIPTSWDEEGNVSGLGIETFDEDFFLIEPRNHLDRLKPFLRRQIELYGALKRSAGKKTIRVRDFRALN